MPNPKGSHERWCDVVAATVKSTLGWDTGFVGVGTVADRQAMVAGGQTMEGDGALLAGMDH